MAQKLLLESERPRREVVLVTDFQLTGWEGAERTPLPAGTELRIVDLSDRDRYGSSPSNLAVASVVFDRVEVGGRERIELQARVTNLGSAPLPNVKATLELNGRDVESRELSLQGDETVVVAFQGFSLPEGLSRGAVRLSGDALQADNEYSFVLDRSQALPVLLVEGPRVSGPSSGFYVEKSLRLDRRPPIRLRSVRAGRLSADDLEAAAVVFLSDVALPTGPTAEALRRFVEKGGGLFLALGSRSDDDRHASLFEAGLVPRIIGAPVRRGRSEAAARISFFDRGYPGFEDFSAPRSGDFGTARFFRYHRVEADPEIDRVLARFDDGHIALLERQFGQGRILLWTSTLDRYWNDFALKPLFVPFLHQSVRRLSRHQSLRPWHEVGELVDLQSLLSRSETPEGEAPSIDRIVDPQGVRSDPQDFLALEKGGFYEVHFSDGEESVIAVNLDTRESDLSTLDPEEFAAAIAAPQPVARASGPSPERSAEQSEAAQGLWRYLVAALLLLLISETVLSNRRAPA